MTICELKEYIYSQDKISFILESLNCHHIKYHAVKKYWSCGNPDGDNISAVIVYNNSNLSVQNFTRDLTKVDAYPDIITLVKFYLNKDFRNAVKWLHSILNLKYTYTVKTTETHNPLHIFKSINKYKPNSIEYRILNEDLLLDFYPYVHKDFAAEGILKSTIKKFQLGYSYEANGTIIPVRYWLDGSLIGIIRRTSVKNYKELNIPKYFPIKAYAKAGNIYGLWEHYNDIQQKGYCVVYEAQKSVLKRDTLKDYTGTALCGHDISEEQIKILGGLNLKEIIIALDKDISQNEVRGQCEKFYGIRNVSYILDTENLLDEKDAPVDKGNEVFKYLFDHRIKYDEEEHQKYQKYINSFKNKSGE